MARSRLTPIQVALVTRIARDGVKDLFVIAVVAHGNARPWVQGWRQPARGRPDLAGNPRRFDRLARRRQGNSCLEHCSLSRSAPTQRMIRKSGYRFSEKIMRKQ